MEEIVALLHGISQTIIDQTTRGVGNKRAMNAHLINTRLEQVYSSRVGKVLFLLCTHVIRCVHDI
jgi:hypothetical protein